MQMNFKPWSKPNEALFWGNDFESILMEKNSSVWYIYILPIFDFVCKKLHFSRQTVENISLNMHRFACKANRDSKSEIETSYELVSTPQMQWWPQNFKTSLR